MSPDLGTKSLAVEATPGFVLFLQLYTQRSKTIMNRTHACRCERLCKRSIYPDKYDPTHKYHSAYDDNGSSACVCAEPTVLTGGEEPLR